jgi:curved DNA-binding protein
MNIPADTDGDRIFRLKGMGMPVYGKAGHNGDGYARVIFRVPKQLSEKEKELLTQLVSLDNKA